MHGFGTPVKRPPDSITPRFRRPMRTTSTLQKTFLPTSKNISPIAKKKARKAMVSNHRLPAFNALLPTLRTVPLDRVPTKD